MNSSQDRQPAPQGGRKKRPSQLRGGNAPRQAAPTAQYRHPSPQAAPRQAASRQAPRQSAPRQAEPRPYRERTDSWEAYYAQPTQRRQKAPQQRPRRKRRWPWVVAVAVVVALWIPVAGLLLNPLSNAPEAQQAEQSATADSQATEEQAATEESAVEEESSTASESDDEPAAKSKSESTESESSEAAAPAADLAWRDEDFAVDPAKQTEWNYEPNGRKVVYLTIDDGPSENTQAVLDILDRYNCKATFFVTGICPDYAYQIKEEYRRGHTVGMHTYSHDYAQVYASVDSYFADLDQIAQVVREQIGYVPCFVRFPGGSSNGISADYCTGIMSALVNELPAAGYQYYDWNASTGDGSEHTADELHGYACEFDDLENVVLLCHDSSTKQSTVEALPRIIEHYQDLGYTFEAIDRSSMVPHHGVSN